MVKKIVIAGCRDFNDYETAKEYIDFCLGEISQNNEIVILCGDCRGADALGEKYALSHGWKVEHYPADWDAHGRAAGPIRNGEMAKACDGVIAFWDGKSRGTSSMIREAKKHNKPVKIKLI